MLILALFTSYLHALMACKRVLAGVGLFRLLVGVCLRWIVIDRYLVLSLIVALIVDLCLVFDCRLVADWLVIVVCRLVPARERLCPVGD